MNNIKSIFTNKWFKLGVSILTASYTVLLCFFAYAVTFFNIEYTNRVEFAIFYSIFSFLTCGLMFYTRESPFVAIFAMINMVILLPTLLIDFGNWPLLIPAIIVTLFSFFCCNMNATAKTVLGTIFLLMYIVGGIAFYVIMNVFRTTTVDTLITSEVSASGSFRYYVLDAQNKAAGKVIVYVEPNNLDVDLKFIKLDNTIKKMIKQANKPVEIKCEWRGEDLYINDSLYFTESQFLEQKNGVEVYNFKDTDWTYSSTFNFSYPLIDTINSVKKNIKEKLDESDKADTKATEVQGDEETSAEGDDTETSESETETAQNAE